MTPFEDFLFYDSRKKGSPADAVTILMFRGRLDFTRMKRAILQAAERSNRANDCANLHENGTLGWKKGNHAPEIHWIPASPKPENLPDSEIDILTEPGIRFYIYAPPEKDSFQIWFQFHHLTTDAIGSFNFLNEIFENYANIIPERPEVADYWEILEATKPKYSVRLILSAVVQVFSFLLSRLNPWRMRPAEFRDAQADGTTSLPRLLPHLPILFQTFDRKRTQHLLRTARERGVSLNDFLIATAFRAAARLECALFSKKSSTRCSAIQIAIPMNMRTEKYQSMPLRNLVSVLFLRESCRWCTRKGRFSKLLKRIHLKIRASLRARRGELLLLELKWLASVWLHGNHRWGMNRFVQRQEPLATLVLSNLGVLFQKSPLPRTNEGFLQVGDLVLEQVHQASPRTTDAALTIALGTYADQLHFGLHPDPERLGDAATRQFLDFWVEEMESLSPFPSVEDTDAPCEHNRNAVFQEKLP